MYSRGRSHDPAVAMEMDRDGGRGTEKHVGSLTVPKSTLVRPGQLHTRGGFSRGESRPSLQVSP